MMLFTVASAPRRLRRVPMTMSSCAGTHAMAMRQPLSFDGVHNFLDTLFGDDLHAKRVKSLAGATLGAIQSASLAVGLIGQGLALARGRLTKHAVKQVDRLLSNQGIDRRNGYEYQVLVRLAEILPADVRVRIVADRGFGDHKLYRVLSEELKFDF